MRKKHTKLVRDKIPEIIDRSQKKYECKILSRTEFIEALQDKIVEEAGEIAKASNSEEIIQEIADLYEVIDTLLMVKNIERELVLTAQQQKKQARGGFARRLQLIWTEE